MYIEPKEWNKIPLRLRHKIRSKENEYNDDFTVIDKIPEFKELYDEARQYANFNIQYLIKKHYIRGKRK